MGVSHDKVRRHDLIDRLYHWVMAVAIFTLLATAFLPKVGIKFEWLTTHWVAGIVLTVIVLAHIIRAVIWQDFWSMMIDGKDIVNAWRSFVGVFSSATQPGKPGKYNAAQKLYHLGIIAFVFALIGSGLTMMFKIDTPFWKRDPYIFTDEKWGVIYAIHGLGAMGIITMIMIHIYFALRPDEWHLTRTMFRGWMTRREYEDHHDRVRWTPRADN